MSKVIIEKITEKDNLKQTVSKMIEGCGGLNRFVQRGETVLIKPNLVTPRSADDGVTTDPLLIDVVSQLALEGGADRVFICDSPAQGIDGEEVLSPLKFLEDKGEGRIELINLDQVEMTEVELNDCTWLKKIAVPEILTRVDRIWNLPKAKTHYIDKLTGAVKNYVGFIPVKKRLDSHQTGLSHLVASLHRRFKVDLIVVDALYVGEGEGPNLVSPRKYNVVLVGDNPVEIDSVVGYLFGFDYRELEFAMNAHNLGVGEIDYTKIDIRGIDPDQISFKIKRSCKGIVARYNPVNLIIGGACPGCLTWVKGELEGWLQNGIMQQLEDEKKKISFMMGFNAIDERFTEHLKEGKYFVVGDCTPAEYKNDPRVIFIPGCCPGKKIPEATNDYLDELDIHSDNQLF